MILNWAYKWLTNQYRLAKFLSLISWSCKVERAEEAKASSIFLLILGDLTTKDLPHLIHNEISVNAHIAPVAFSTLDFMLSSFETL